MFSWAYGHIFTECESPVVTEEMAAKYTLTPTPFCVAVHFSDWWIPEGIGDTLYGQILLFWNRKRN